MSDRRRLPMFLAAWLLAAAAPTTALAHQVYVFASVDGHTIQGKVYFRGQIAAQGVTVTAFDPAGRELAKTTTDDQGQFHLEAKYRCDYRLLADAGDGHGAEWVVAAAQLPADLPPRDVAAADAGPAAEDVKTSTPSAPAAVPADNAPPPAASNELAGLRADINALRQQLIESDQRVRLRDILGGIGYILGLAGLAFYLAARRSPSKT